MFWGGSFGLGFKPGKSVFWNLAYPYVAFMGGQTTDSSDYIELAVAQGMSIGQAETQKEWVYGWEYGLRSHLAFFFLQGGYSTLAEDWSFSFGIQTPAGYMD